MALGIVLNEVKRTPPGLAIGASHLVQLPEATGLTGLVSWLSFPDFAQLGNVAVYTTALTLAVVASLETLLCVEATDRLDPEKRVIGGLPLSSRLVGVRSTPISLAR